MSSAWDVVERSDVPAQLVGALPDPAGRRRACFVNPVAPALVLGSAQAASVADEAGLAAAGASLERRRSGGGAVFVSPGGQLWLDVFVPVGDRLFVDDVGRSTWWLGELWAEALCAAGAASAAELEVHRGTPVASRWSRIVCFAGIGAGEVTVRGRKVVGVSQRRDRSGAWLHSMGLVSHDPVRLAALLAMEPSERALLVAHLDQTVAVLGDLSRLVTTALRVGLDSVSR